MAVTVTKDDIMQVMTIPDGINANSYINYVSVFVKYNSNLNGYPDDQLKAIQVFLTCHFIMAFEPQSMKYTDVSLNSKSFGEQLASTTYGQLAMGQDTSGYLTGFGKKKARLFSVGGCNPPISGQVFY